MLEVEFNRKGLKSPGLGVLLESLRVQSVASLLSSRISIKKKCFSVLVFGLVFCFPPLRSETNRGSAKILLNGGSIKIPFSALRGLPWCEETF